MNRRTRVARTVTSVIGLGLLLVAVVQPVSASYAPSVAAALASRKVNRAPAGEPADAAVADFNADGHADIAMAQTGGGLSVRWGTSKGVYAEPVSIDGVRFDAKRLVAADVTADGVADVLAYSPGGTKLFVAPSNRSGGFLPVRTVRVDQGIQYLATGSFDRRGGADVAIVSATTNELVMLHNRDDRSGFEASTFALDGKPLSAVALRLNADSMSEIVVGMADNRLVTVADNGTGFSVAKTTQVDLVPNDLVAFDVNRDGWMDVVAGSRSGALASMHGSTEGLSSPVVSKIDGTLARMSIGFVDEDGLADVIAVGAGIATVYGAQPDGTFVAPRQIANYTDVVGATIAPSAKGRQHELVLSRHSGLTVEAVQGPLNKLRGSFVVTNCSDYRWQCPPVPAPGAQAVVGPVPPGSLRAAIMAANGSGPSTITFSLGLNGAVGGGGYSAASLVQHIVILNTLPVTGSGIQIIGESVNDTNPFGPDIAIQPLNNAGWLAALEDMAPTASDFRVQLFDAFTVSGADCELSSLIIAGTNFGGFFPITLTNCNNPMTNTDVAFVASNFRDGVFINGGSGSQVRASLLGTDQRGFGVATPTATSTTSAAIGIFSAGGCLIGGADIADRNIIVSSTNGVLILNGAGNEITGNIIGSDGTVGGRPGGTTPINGVFLQTSTNTEISLNTIGGSSEAGILGTDGSSGTSIVNNRIGVDRFGNEGNGTQNSNGGVIFNASSNGTVGPANIISTNVGQDTPNSGGILITGSSVASDNNTIADNTISKNNANGVSIELGSGNTVGPNNVISENEQFGIAVVAGTGNTITTNSMTKNGTLGINLVSPNDPPSGITENDDTDADSGPNDLLNFPVFQSSVVDSTSVIVSGTAPAGSLVEIFSSDAQHANGEGVEFLISTTATSGGSFTVTLPLTLPLDDSLKVTATATDAAGNTSEFGPNFNLNQRLSVSPSSITFPTTAVGGTTSRTITICNNGVSNLTIGSITVNPPGGPFSLVGVPEADTVLAPSECITITVLFSPTSASNFSGSVVIESDDPENPTFTVTLGGTAVNAQIILNVSSITLPQVAIGGERTASVTVTNPTEVPVTVSGIQFLRRGTAKVSFADRNDPFFTASPTTFTLPPNGTQSVLLTFHPRQPIPSPDTRPPFDLPTPAYQTPKKVKTDVVFVVSDTLGITASLLATAKVRPDPGITGGSGTWVGDRLDLAVDTFDPDSNLANARFVFYNESFVELFKINDTPGVPEAFRKIAKGVNVPLTFTFTGLLPFQSSLKFLDVTVIDAAGTSSNTVRFTVVFESAKDGTQHMTLMPVANQGSFTDNLRNGIALPPIVLSNPRR